MLDAHGVRRRGAARILHELATRDFVGLEREVRGWLGRTPPQPRGPPQLRGGAEVLDAVRRGREAGRCATCYALLAPRSPQRVIFDLGLVATLGYYTGAVFEVYDAALGVAARRRRALRRPARPLRPRPAGRAGWALDVERLHMRAPRESGCG